LKYNTTLAKPTSLEEMMRYMMDDDQILEHPFTGSERPLPKQQRQGAIIIIRMVPISPLECPG
jgi:hypothetical protein